MRWVEENGGGKASMILLRNPSIFWYGLITVQPEWTGWDETFSSSICTGCPFVLEKNIKCVGWFVFVASIARHIASQRVTFAFQMDQLIDGEQSFVQVEDLFADDGLLWVGFSLQGLSKTTGNG